MMKKLFLLFVVSIGLLLPGTAQQQKKITLEDIWQDYTFYPNTVPGFNFLNDGKHYTRLEQDKINQYDITTGGFVTTLLDAQTISGQEGFNGSISSYQFSKDESKILIKSQVERIYRHSTRARFFVYDTRKQELESVYDEKVRYATFDDAAQQIAFVYQNNLYVKSLKSGKVTAVTKDGKENEIINGATDWVYEEEFSFHRGFQWSPDGKRLAFYRFDESEVAEFTMTNYKQGLYPEYVTFKYPKVEREKLRCNHPIFMMLIAKKQ